jgi:hypothetical protein
LRQPATVRVHELTGSCTRGGAFLTGTTAWSWCDRWSDCTFRFAVDAAGRELSIRIADGHWLESGAGLAAMP